MRSAARAVLPTAPMVFALVACQAIFGVDEDDTGDTTSSSGGASAASTGGGDTSSAGGADASSSSAVGGMGAGGEGGGCTPLDLPGGGPAGACSKANMIKVAFADASPFCIDRWEVQRGDYRGWLESCPDLADQRPECLDNVSFEPTMGLYDCDAVQDGLDGDPLLPVVCVDWCDADAYCRGVGKRLCGAKGGGPTPFDQYGNPDASEWYSACSDHGTRSYTYGSAPDATKCVGAEYTGVPGPAAVAEPTPVDSCKDPVYALWDMSGNVWEWEDSCAAAIGLGDQCRTRGGSFWEAAAALTCTTPGPTNHVRSGFNNNIGFRCCADPN